MSPSALASRKQPQETEIQLALHIEAQSDVPDLSEIDASNDEIPPIIKELTSICTDTIVSATAKMKALKARQAAAYSKAHSKEGAPYYVFRMRPDFHTAEGQHIINSNAEEMCQIAFCGTDCWSRSEVMLVKFDEECIIALV